MKKRMKKNNKGFSLVELIVVVLIMAIIAVALAPQVMKWVNNARITADQNAAGNLKTAVQVAVADFQSKGGTMNAVNYTINNAAVVTIKSGDTEPTISGTTPVTLKSLIDENIGGETYATKSDSSGFTIVITAKGAVTVTCGATTKTLD